MHVAHSYHKIFKALELMHFCKLDLMHKHFGYSVCVCVGFTVDTVNLTWFLSCFIKEIFTPVNDHDLLKDSQQNQAFHGFE